MLDIGHRLRPAGHDDAGGTGGDLTRGVQHRLQAGTAASVDLKSGDAGAQPRIEGRDPADRGRFAAGVAVAEDHVVHVAFTESGADDQLAQGGSGELGGGECGQRAPHSPDRSAERIADHDVGHASTV